MVVDGVDAPRDFDGEGVPTALGRVVLVEVVLRVLAGTVALLDDVLVVVADDDGEITVLFDSLLGDGVDGAPSPVTVGREDGVDDWPG